LSYWLPVCKKLSGLFLKILSFPAKNHLSDDIKLPINFMLIFSYNL
jgi:hypothetical protein